MIPMDMALVEWITFVGCSSGTTMAIVEIAEKSGGEHPPFRPIFEALLANEDVIAFLFAEGGAVVTYKRKAGERAPSNTLN